jgi:hypothetical protein
MLATLGTIDRSWLSPFDRFTVSVRGKPFGYSMGVLSFEGRLSRSEMPIPNDVQMLLPWESLEGDEMRVNLFFTRLKDDLPSTHRLYGLRMRALAARVDRDDVLFEVEGGAGPLAVVHMTWQKETDPRWPRTKFFQSWSEWSRDEMLPSHQEYSVGAENN